MGTDKCKPCEGKLTIEDFDHWLKRLVFPREVDDFIEVIYDGGQGDEDGYEMKKEINFYTDHHIYHIVAIEREDEEKSYLGCQVSARKPRAGETWHRGNDLPDGLLCKKTLEQIKNAIIAYEMVPLSVRVPSKSIEEIELSNGGKNVNARSKTGLSPE